MQRTLRTGQVGVTAVAAVLLAASPAVAGPLPETRFSVTAVDAFSCGSAAARCRRPAPGIRAEVVTASGRVLARLVSTASGRSAIATLPTTSLTLRVPGFTLRGRRFPAAEFPLRLRQLNGGRVEFKLTFLPSGGVRPGG
jgi:hypothetical protein